mmetsp:Transcript_25680/g.40613  ORF Transcript_25680/g.40613 Transcript_25680/m.40613 type:complete len:171 (-) Transcript_25680:91-603(-)
METALPRRVMETAYVVGDNVKTIRLAKIEEAEIPRDTRGVVVNEEGSILFERCGFVNRWMQFTKSQMNELLVKDERADRAWLNKKSRGHPHFHFCVSASGCKFIKKGRGCKDEECDKCHLCLWKERNQEQRLGQSRRSHKKKGANSEPLPFPRLPWADLEPDDDGILTRG